MALTQEGGKTIWYKQTRKGEEDREGGTSCFHSHLYSSLLEKEGLVRD